MATYTVYYMRPEFMREGTGGSEWLAKIGQLPKPSTLDKTHIRLKTITLVEITDSHNAIIGMMQGENWSPNGEAKPLIRSLGLSHTSMTTGDIIVDEAGAVFMLDRFGFIQLQE